MSTNGMITVAKKSNNLDYLKYAYKLGIRDYRINMDYEDEVSLAISNLESLRKLDIRTFADFQGVKMRIQLAPGQNDLKFQIGDVYEIYFAQERYPHISNFSNIHKYLREGQIISIADGKIVGSIIKIEDTSFKIEFTKVGYVLRHNAGCSFLGEDIPTPRMTKNACERILHSKIIRECQVDWIILSFVESPDDISDFVNTVHKIGLKVMAKIETINGVDNIERIATVVDGLMLGRGDLKNTTEEMYDLYLQKALVEMKKITGLYKGVGTFFLSKYSQSKNKLEYEIADVKNMVNLGLDYIMLSKEVVNSDYHIETLEFLQDLCKK